MTYSRAGHASAEVSLQPIDAVREPFRVVPHGAMVIVGIKDQFTVGHSIREVDGVLGRDESVGVTVDDQQRHGDIGIERFERQGVQPPAQVDEAGCAGGVAKGLQDDLWLAGAKLRR